MKRTFAVALALLVVPLAFAQEEGEEHTGFNGGYDDTWGDASTGLDIHRIEWGIAPGFVAIQLDASLQEEAAVTAILYAGTVGADEPTQAYIMHHGPEGDRILLAQNGTAPGMEVHVDGRSVEFHLDEPVPGECFFAVARTATYAEEGQTIHDVVGWSGTDIDAAWSKGVACTDGAPLDITINAEPLDESFAVPALGWVGILGVVVVGAVLRRPQRP